MPLREQVTRTEAESLFIAEALPQVRNAASRYARRSRLPFDDLCQVGLLRAWESLQRFDPVSGAKLGEFLKLQILGAFMDYARAKSHPLGWQTRGGRRDALPRGCSLDHEEFVDEGMIQDSDEPAEFERLIKPLASREKAVIRMIFRSGMTHRAIASELHCSETTVQNVFNRSLAVLRERWRTAA